MLILSAYSVAMDRMTLILQRSIWTGVKVRIDSILFFSSFLSFDS